MASRFADRCCTWAFTAAADDCVFQALRVKGVGGLAHWECLGPRHLAEAEVRALPAACGFPAHAAGAVLLSERALADGEHAFVTAFDSRLL